MMAVMRHARMAVLSAILVVAVSSIGGAQRPDRPPGRPGAAAQAGQAGLERQFRERFAEVVRRRLNLNDDQMRQLGQVNDRFERDRMRLLREERQMRQALRSQVLAGDSANERQVAELLDRAIQIQRQRLDIAEREQRELATFMSPIQRAQYTAIQDDLRRRLEEFRQQRRPGTPGMGGRRQPPQ